MLFERLFNKTFILFERFFKHEQLCYLNEFSKHEQLCYLNEFSIKHLHCVWLHRIGPRNWNWVEFQIQDGNESVPNSSSVVWELGWNWVEFQIQGTEVVAAGLELG